MLEPTDRLSERDLRSFLSGELPPSKVSAVRKGLQADRRAQQLYDRLVHAERALEGHQTTESLGTGARARVAQRLFEGRPASNRWLSVSWLPMLVASATAVLAVGVMAPLVDAPAKTGEFASRGEGSTDRPTISPDRTLQVLKVTVDPAGQVRVEPAKQLQSGDHLRFAAFVRNDGWRLSILAELSNGRRYILSRRSEIEVRPGAQRLDVALTIPADWKGPVRFIGVFERSGHRVELATIDLRGRDDTDVSLRVVRAIVGGPG